MPNPNSFELLARVENGDDRAATEVFDRYVARLRAMVRDRIAKRLRRRLDADDVVQSTYRSFFTHAEQGDYALTKSGDLWRLLASIALHKLYGQVEQHTAARRSINREAAAGDSFLQRAPEPEPTAAEVVAITEQLHLIGQLLTDDQRNALIAHLQGESADEIAAHAQKSPRTIRRLLAEARSEFERELLHESRLRGRPPEDQLLPAANLSSLAYADFTLERLVGAGGMGKVYRAIDRRAGNHVAIKTLAKSRQRNRNVVQKFLQEAQILAKLAHPNIVAFHGIGRFPGGGYFLVMDYIEGTDLQARIARTPLPANEALRIFRQIADAVHYAHASGIIHGDIKPANVLLNKSSQPIVTDFGLAQLIDASPQNSPRLIGGTTGFIAPEVRTGHTAPTVASDIYGLGALLVALLTGSPPEPSNLLSQTPALQSLCKKCLAPNPANRYQSVDDLVAQLQPF